MVALGFWNKPPAGRGIGFCSVRKRKTPSGATGAKGKEGEKEEEDEDDEDILKKGYHRGDRLGGTGMSMPCSDSPAGSLNPINSFNAGYIQTSWHRFDFLILLLSWGVWSLGIIFGTTNQNVTSIRAIRVLKIVKSVKHLKGLQQMIKAG